MTDSVYRERAHLVALLTRLYPAHIGYTDADEPDYAIVMLETPAGQLSWHIAPDDMDLFQHVPETDDSWRPWDGHTTEEKYERLENLLR